jgi:hypothetical protein
VEMAHCQNYSEEKKRIQEMKYCPGGGGGLCIFSDGGECVKYSIQEVCIH